MKHYPLVISGIAILSLMYFVTQGYFSLKAEGQKSRDIKNCVNGASYPLLESGVTTERIQKDLDMIKIQCYDIYHENQAK